MFPMSAIRLSTCDNKWYFIIHGKKKINIPVTGADIRVGKKEKNMTVTVEMF